MKSIISIHLPGPDKFLNSLLLSCGSTYVFGGYRAKWAMTTLNFKKGIKLLFFAADLFSSDLFTSSFST